jgi:segregation and condensation protein A
MNEQKTMEVPPTGYEIKLDVFEGPLDLLLYLIKKNEIDIYNIPMAVITEQYLQHLDVLKSLNLDLAGEYLVMASTLIHIKSRMLLPVEEEQGEPEEEDPRADLVRQLLEYQAFKEVALSLDSRLLLGRDVFRRDIRPEEIQDEAAGAEGEQDLMELDVFELVAAFQRMAVNLRKDEVMEIDVEKMSLADRMNEIMDVLSKEKDATFNDLLGGAASRKRIIYTFLALLELMKLRLIRAFQAGAFGPIRIFLAVEN